jgi:DivIVA domain-containing protein
MRRADGAGRVMDMSKREEPRFGVTRFREAYAMNDVDDFLQQVRPLLEGRLPDPELAQRIRDVRFALVRLRPGYDMDDVDKHLEGMATLASQGHPRY